MQVRDAEARDLRDEVRELRHWVIHLHAVVRAPWAEAETYPLPPDGSTDCCNQLDREPGSVLDAAAVFIHSLVASILRELVDEISVGAVDLDPVEPRLDGIFRRGDVCPDLSWISSTVNSRGGSRPGSIGVALELYMDIPSDSANPAMAARPGTHCNTPSQLSLFGVWFQWVSEASMTVSWPEKKTCARKKLSKQEEIGPENALQAGRRCSCPDDERHR